ncbi:MAG: hypothetical protein R8L07_17375 [Alphaproteobacteria bacterium]|nr:hypothetical protein [Alphaproteobacteria bacterium]
MSGKIIATQYMSLDGVIEDPVGDKFKDDELSGARALIFGRKTYDGFAADWPTVSGTPHVSIAHRTDLVPSIISTLLAGE